MDPSNAPPLGDIRIIDLLGRGGMGLVYRGFDERLGRPVVVKVLDPDLACRDEHRQRFLREAQAAARLRHPNIVDVFGVIETPAEPGGPPTFGIVMEFIEGETLDRRIERAGPLPLAEAARIARAVATGLAYAHRHGVIHRDIKPANVIVSASGDVKILDFGLARLADSKRLSQTGEVLGTLAYMPPEQAEGARTIDPRADLYALGATLHALLAGAAPFGGTGASLLKQVLLDPPPPISAVRPDVPWSVEAFIARCLAKEPDERPVSAEAFRDELAAALAGRAPPGALRRRLRRALLAGGAAALLALGLAAVLWLPGALRARALCEALAPADPREQIVRLDAFIERYPGDPEAVTARESARARARAILLGAAAEIPDAAGRADRLAALQAAYPGDAELAAALAGSRAEVRIERLAAARAERDPAARLARLAEFLGAYPADPEGLADYRLVAPWTEIRGAGPSDRLMAAMAFDEARGVMVLFGGWGSHDPEVAMDDMWIFDGATWRTVAADPHPPGRYGHGMVFDRQRGVVLLYAGGDTTGHLQDDLWAWDGVRWTELHPPASPEGRARFGMAYDEAHEVTVVFGPGNETLLFDGSRFVRTQPRLAPTPRYAPSLAYDAARERIVLFGGYDQRQQALDDTWEWDGSQWYEVPVPARPPARADAALVYDRRAGVTLLFGGGYAQGALDDLWAFDGSSWTRLSPPSHPAARRAHALAFDGNVGGLLLFAGRDPERRFGDAWLWRGAPP